MVGLLEVSGDLCLVFGKLAFSESEVDWSVPGPVLLEFSVRVALECSWQWLTSVFGGGICEALGVRGRFKMYFWAGNCAVAFNELLFCANCSFVRFGRCVRLSGPRPVSVRNRGLCKV